MVTEMNFVCCNWISVSMGFFVGFAEVFSYDQNVIHRLHRALWWESHCLYDLLLTLVMLDSAAILSKLYTLVLLE